MKRQSLGFTLIEMMIAIVLGIIIILGVGQIFVASRMSFSAQQGLSHVQQSGRFAMEFVGNAVRAAGDMGFSNTSSLMQSEAAPATSVTSTTIAKLYQITNTGAAGAEVAAAINFAIPLQVYEWVGSAPGSTVNLPATVTAGSAATNWNPPLPAFVASRAVAGSDVIIARYVEGRTFQIAYVSGAASAIAGISVQNVCGAAGQGLEIGVSTTNSVTGTLTAENLAYEQLVAAKSKRLIVIGQNDVAVVAQSVVHQASPLVLRTFGAVGFPGNYTDAARMCGPFNLTPPISVARVGLARVDIFYVGANATSGEPGLWRMSFDGSDALPFVSEEMVEGIENMQVLAGITLPDGSKRASNRPDRYVTGAELMTPASIGLTGESVSSASRRALGARIALLVRSENGTAGQVNALTYQVNGTTINPADDRRIRQVYDQTIGVRNRQRVLNGGADNY